MFKDNRKKLLYCVGCQELEMHRKIVTKRPGMIKNKPKLECGKLF